MKTNETTYIFVIDTENYSGEFEREMTAYMTGVVGDYGIGEEEAKLFNKEMKLRKNANTFDQDHPFNFVLLHHNDSGINSPCNVWPTPGWFNHGLGGFFRDGEEAEALIDYRKKCLAEANKTNHNKTNKSYWLEKQANKALVKYEAFLSVAIFMKREPNQAEIDILVGRAKTFAKRKRITITGFRLLSKQINVIPILETKL